MDVIEKAKEYVKQLFENDFSGHDYAHTLRVYHLALELAEKEKADCFIVALAALLHDADDEKLSETTAKDKSRAKQFLKQQHLDQCIIEQVIEIIKQVSFVGTDSKVPDTIEGKCVQDADRLDAIGAIGIARCFTFGGYFHRVMYDLDQPPCLNMNQQQYRNHVSTTINHFYEKLFLLKDLMNTETAKQIAQERDQFTHQFVERFWLEVNGKK